MDSPFQTQMMIRRRKKAGWKYLEQNIEIKRRGPHKSMHCKFCKPPGTVYFSDIPTPAQLETKTKLHLSHEVADLKVYDVYDEPGVIEEEAEACICQLEGSGACPKCAPDKTRKPVKKKVCTCPVGAKPNPNMAILDVTNQKKKKEKIDDDEFWWEKYEREHDAMVKETWAAYLAQRKLDRKLSKCKELERLRMSGLMRPPWFQKLSCQQTIYLEYLSTAIRLDLDENITDRTEFILRGIGFYPRPKKKMLQKCLRYCHYNAVRFLNQLSMLLQDEDPYGERIPLKSIPLKNQDIYSWNDRILMACICHLEFPKLLREIMDRLPPLPQEPLPPYIPKPKFRKTSITKYSNPYEEPVWVDQMNWLEKRKLDGMNRLREHLSLKRVKIPSLALVRRPSLIDARPPFLSQIEANQSFNRRRKSSKKKIRMFRKKKKAIFDSKVDVTAIAGIEASEVSTTPKADPDEICVFLRGREPATESIPEEEEIEFESEVEEEEERKVEPILEPRVKYGEGMSTKSGSSGPLKMHEEMVYALDEASDDDIPFVTPPKTQSGRTIEEPCPPPKGSPGPPASHFNIARREIGLINEELCSFDPNEVKSDDDEEKADLQSVINMDIEHQLKEVVRKLRQLNLGEEEPEEIPKAPKKKRRKKRVKKGEQGNPNTLQKIKVIPKSRTKNNEQKKVEEPVSDGQADVNGVLTTDVEKEESDESCFCGQEKQKKKKGRKKAKSKKRKRSKKRKVKKRHLDPCRTPKKSERSKDSEETNFNSDSDKRPEVDRDNKAKMTDAEKKSSSEESSALEDGAGRQVEEEKIFYGNLAPLLKTILKDLNEEGFISAGYEEIYRHPDIKQLIKYLHGEILTKTKKESLNLNTRWLWRLLDKKGKPRPVIRDLKIPQKRLDKATWNDKKWLTSLIRKKKDEYYYYIAKHRADDAKNLYLTLNQEYFGSERFLKSYYAYMIAARHESIVRGII